MSILLIYIPTVLMKYVGGKHLVGKKIADFITQHCPPELVAGYYEPFCGSLGVFKHMTDRGYSKCIASDTHADLMAMWIAVQKGRLRVPRNITEKRYKKLRASKGPSPLKAVAGFGISYGGKYFEGYAPNAAGSTGRDFLNEFRNSIATIAPAIRRSNVVFKKQSYWNIKPSNMLIYCDPPYYNTQGYSTGEFDHERFWNVMREWSKNNLVFVSEETAPKDFCPVLSFRKRRTLDSRNRANSTERLFVYAP